MLDQTMAVGFVLMAIGLKCLSDFATQVALWINSFFKFYNEDLEDDIDAENKSWGGTSIIVFLLTIYLLFQFII
jgi:hypothetical protein